MGLAPFHIHDHDCQPKNLPTELVAGSGVSEWAFLSTTDIPAYVRFYGPVLPSPGFSWTGAVKVECRPLVVPTGDSPCNWIDVSGAFRVFGPNTDPTGGDVLGRRDIGVCCRTNQRVRAGIFRLRAMFDDDGMMAVRSKHVTEIPETVWSISCPGVSGQAPAYVFRVIPDCNQDGLDDMVTPPRRVRSATATATSAISTSTEASRFKTFSTSWRRTSPTAASLQTPRRPAAARRM